MNATSVTSVIVFNPTDMLFEETFENPQRRKVKSLCKLVQQLASRVSRYLYLCKLVQQSNWPAANVSQYLAATGRL